MRRVEFVDTSVLLNILNVPGFNQDHDVVLEEFLEKAQHSETDLILPVTAVIESGNHIAQLPDGATRRQYAEGYVALLRNVASGRAPWVLHEVAWDAEIIKYLCDGVRGTGEFVEVAMRKDLGTGDLAILAERERFLTKAVVSSAVVWTLDEKLAAYAA